MHMHTVMGKTSLQRASAIHITRHKSSQGAFGSTGLKAHRASPQTVLLVYNSKGNNDRDRDRGREPARCSVGEADKITGLPLPCLPCDTFH